MLATKKSWQSPGTVSLPQIRILKALDSSGPLTRQEIQERARVASLADALAPAPRDGAATCISGTLLGLGLVRATFEETEKGSQEVRYSLTREGAQAAVWFVLPAHARAADIPPNLLDPVVEAFRGSRPYGFEVYTDLDLQSILDSLGVEYANVPLESLRQRTINRRKQGAYASQVTLTFPDWYREYRDSQYFQGVRDYHLMAYGYSCSLNSDHVNGVEVYHRRFKDVDGLILGRETVADCVVLCSDCFKKNAKRIKRVPMVRP